MNQTLPLFDALSFDLEPQPAPAEPMPEPVSSEPTIKPATLEAAHSTASAPERIRFLDEEPERAFWWVFRGNHNHPDWCCWTTMEAYSRYKREHGTPQGSRWVYQFPDGAVVCCPRSQEAGL